MTTQDTTELLVQLRGIHMPQAPVEPQSWPLIVAAAVIAAALLFYFFGRYRSNVTWAKQAGLELERIKHTENLQGLQSIAVLLKRIVITHDHTSEVKHLYGDKWLRYLDNFFSTRYFTQGDGQVFGTAQYREHHQLSPGHYKDIKALIKRKARAQGSKVTSSTTIRAA